MTKLVITEQTAGQQEGLRVQIGHALVTPSYIKSVEHGEIEDGVKTMTVTFYYDYESVEIEK